MTEDMKFKSMSVTPTVTRWSPEEKKEKPAWSSEAEIHNPEIEHPFLTSWNKLYIDEKESWPLLGKAVIIYSEEAEEKFITGRVNIDDECAVYYVAQFNNCGASYKSCFDFEDIEYWKYIEDIE